jgi:Holliday junction DNA helicase RuvA
MIASLIGQLQEKSENYAVINVQGVGYKVFLNNSTLSKLGSVGSVVEVRTFMDVKEDSLQLFGFAKKEEYELFTLLIGVKGVGPKGALQILDLAPVEELKEMIAEAQIKMLTQVSGIGKKTAERLVLELKDKVGYLAGSTVSGVGEGKNGELRANTNDLVDALESLGFQPQEIRMAINSLDSSVSRLEDQVRMSLNFIQKNNRK